MTRKPRRRRPTDPDAFVKWMDSRRTEMVKEADEQAEANGLDTDTHRDLLNAIVWQECAERANGDPERTELIFGLEIEAIQQDQTRDALEQLIAVLREIGDEYLADPQNYVTAEMESTALGT